MEKLKSILIRIKENRKSMLLAYIFGGVLLLSFILFLFLEKDPPEKILLYQSNKEGKFKLATKSIIENDGSIYQKRENLLKDKINLLEKKIDTLIDDFNRDSSLRKGEEQDDGFTKNDSYSEENTQDSQYEKYEKIDKELQEQEKEEMYEEEKKWGKSLNAQVTPLTSAKETKMEAPVLDTINFPVKRKIDSDGQNNFSVTIPSGSFVKSKLLTGVEAPEGKALPVLLQADFAFVGPNKSKIDLSGCFIIAKSIGNLSIERVEMQASKISCVSKSGRSFERDINGFVADDTDNSFAVMGKVNSKQDRVATMAFLSSIVEGVGKAISQSEASTVTNGFGGQSQMVTGDKAKYVAAGGLSSAASTVTNWYLEHAQGLMPTINIGSGHDIWLVMQDSVKLPNWYFKRSSSRYSGVSFLTRLME